jgi:hypothetical protein
LYVVGRIGFVALRGVGSLKSPGVASPPSGKHQVDVSIALWVPRDKSVWPSDCYGVARIP